MTRVRKSPLFVYARVQGQLRQLLFLLGLGDLLEVGVDKVVLLPAVALVLPLEIEAEPLNHGDELVHGRLAEAAGNLRDLEDPAERE